MNSATSRVVGQVSVFPRRLKDLPTGYGDNRLVLLPRDPYWMFAYWEVNGDKTRELEERYGKEIFQNRRITLRVHEADKGNNTSRRYFDMEVNLDARNWYIRVDVPGRDYFIELGFTTPDGKFIVILRSNIVTLPLGRISDITDEQWMTLREDFDRLMQISGIDKIGIGSMEISKMLAERWEMFKGISSWPGSAAFVSSGEFIKEKHAGFWLKADAELIVYGATDPLATLTVAEKEIPLNPDGTFSIRQYLPEGKVSFPIVAQSADREFQEEVTITVTRKTSRSRE